MSQSRRWTSSGGFFWGGALTLAACVCVPWIPSLEVARVDTRERLFRRYAPPGTILEVRAHHSVEGGVIKDVFETAKGAFLLTTSRFSAQGAGLPASYEPGENWKNGRHAFILEGRRRVIRRVLLRVSEKNENPLRVGPPLARKSRENRPGGFFSALERGPAPWPGPNLGPGLYEIGIFRRSLLSWALP